MATSEKVKFCSACGTKCKFIDRFCGVCEANVSDKASMDDDEKKVIKTFDDYMLLNPKKKSFPTSSTITTRSTLLKKVNGKPVTINVGLIGAAEVITN